LIARGSDETRVRKTVLLVGMCMGLAVYGATRTTELKWAMAWLSIALGGLAFAAPVGWSLPSLVAPRGGVGTLGGIMNFANNAMGSLAPIVTGYIVGATNSFAYAFVVAVAILGVGIVSFAFVLDKVEPIPEPRASSAHTPAAPA
jgi:ACS family D-galactonate transporter-like MFS transporter